MSIELTQQEELAASRLAGSWMGKLCFVGAKAFKGAGIALDTSSRVAATGLRKAADGIETGGQVSSQWCFKQSDKLKQKRQEYLDDTQTVGNVIDATYMCRD